MLSPPPQQNDLLIAWPRIVGSITGAQSTSMPQPTGQVNNILASRRVSLLDVPKNEIWPGPAHLNYPLEGPTPSNLAYTAIPTPVGMERYDKKWL